MFIRGGLAALAAVALLAVSVPANAAHDAIAEMKDQKGQRVGTVVLTQTANGTLLQANFNALPWGAHGFHVHAIGNCKAPFKLAGPHYFTTPGKKHGFLNPNAGHAGDLPNFFVSASGVAEFESVATAVNLDDKLFDGDGASLVIHAGSDDYKTDPGGAAGARIACGIIHR